MGTNIRIISQAIDLTGVLFSDITTTTVPAINTIYITYIMAEMLKDEKKSDIFFCLALFKKQNYNFFTIKEQLFYLYLLTNVK
jgi:hypothetical protein